MANERVLTVTQFGLESAHGTPVAADTKLLCTATLPSADREIHTPAVNAGYRTSEFLDASDVRRVLAEGTLADTDGAYFGLVPVFLSCCLGASGGAPSGIEQNGGEGDYLWTFVDNQTGSEVVESITLEAGQGAQGYEIAYTQIRSVTISGDCETGEVHVSGEFYGDQSTPTTVTPALSLPTVELMNAKLARVYVDATWAALGTNELVGALVNFEVTINGGAHPKHRGGTSRKFSSHGQAGVGGQIVMTLERTSDVYTEEALYRSAAHTVTKRFVRIALTGTQIGTGDTHSIEVDMAGVWTDWNSLGQDSDGNVLDVLTLTAGLDATSERALEVRVTTTQETI